ncbi:MAG: T9SS type A sorting domain-containing protein [Chitinophagaceae bacterium]|nr:T9SS type A sorting domain-containing protein [Chitinophagaceae bacterium]MCW5927945.1 T9SS type A sorting domain-containing protein [Chitinophagaceae bacterium]
MKKRISACVLSLLSYFAFSQNVLHIQDGANLFIQPQALVNLDGLVLTPSGDLLLDNVSIERTTTVQQPVTNSYIQRIYRFNNAMPSFSGIIRFYYEEDELNQLPEATLTLNINNGTAWQDFKTNVTRDGQNNFVETGIPVAVSLYELTLASEQAALPVRLISFEGKAVDGGTLLTWVTAGEMENKGFDVQKSTDGVNFSTIGWVDGRHTTSQVSAYQFTDPQLTATSYYRLRQVDMDGKSTFSKIVVVKYTPAQGLHITAYPNPTFDGSMSVRLPDNTTTVTLFDAGGRVLKTWNKPATHHIVQLPAAGMYLLQVQTGSSLQTVKLIRL